MRQMDYRQEMYKQDEETIERIRNRDEVLFRMSISHLMDVGIRHLTDEAVEATCKSIMEQDDSMSYMTNDYQCKIVRTAAELAKIDHIHLLVYIGKNVCYSV